MYRKLLINQITTISLHLRIRKMVIRSKIILWTRSDNVPILVIMTSKSMDNNNNQSINKAIIQMPKQQND